MSNNCILLAFVLGACGPTEAAMTGDTGSLASGSCDYDFYRSRPDQVPRCNGCGLQYCLPNGQWSALCSPAPSLRPCAEAEVCTGDAQCVPSSEASGCTSGDTAAGGGWATVGRCGRVWCTPCGGCQDVQADPTRPCGGGQTCSVSGECVGAPSGGGCDGGGWNPIGACARACCVAGSCGDNQADPARSCAAGATCQLASGECVGVTNDPCTNDPCHCASAPGWTSDGCGDACSFQYLCADGSAQPPCEPHPELSAACQDPCIANPCDPSVCDRAPGWTNDGCGDPCAFQYLCATGATVTCEPHPEMNPAECQE